MAKKIKTLIKVQVIGGRATPAPPLGPALGQHGMNIAEFCKRINDATQDRLGDVVPAVISLYEDRTYDFILKTAPVSAFLMKAAKIEKGSAKPHIDKVGKAMVINRSSAISWPRLYSTLRCLAYSRTHFR